jgi:acetyl esterase/lipase
VIPLWGEDTPPYSKPHNLEEYEAPCWQVNCAYQVVNPTLTLYTPRGRGNGTAVVVLPGGGYEAEAIYHEGFEIAQTLAEGGTTAAVLKYRLPNPETATKPEQAPLSDVRQALQLLRNNQSQYQFSAARFGVMGFSAGSHLATMVSVNRAEEPDQNPDFSMLIYGVTTFLVHSLDDDECHYTESTLYAETLKMHGVDAEMHLFARGGHGFGPGRDQDGTSQWLELAANWLGRLGARQVD